MEQNQRRKAILPEPSIRDLSLFEWFVGCALSNPAVTENDDPEIVASNAIAVAMASMSALKAPKVPGRIDAPTEEQMDQWLQIINRKNAETIAPLHKRDAVIQVEKRGSVLIVTERPRKNT